MEELTRYQLMSPRLSTVQSVGGPGAAFTRLLIINDTILILRNRKLGIAIHLCPVSSNCLRQGLYLEQPIVSEFKGI